MPAIPFNTRARTTSVVVSGVIADVAGNRKASLADLLADRALPAAAGFERAGAVLGIRQLLPFG
jgi:hypothetical protein